MRFLSFFLVIFLATSTTLFSQEKYITHKIKQGETISSIAEKYNVSQKVIFELNPHAKGILKLQAVLKIPNQNFKKESKEKNKKESVVVKDSKSITYEVLPKETLFSIAKKFNLSVVALKKSNPSLEKTGLRKGQKITIELPKDFELPLEEGNPTLSENKSITSTIDSNEKTNKEAATNSLLTKEQLQSHLVVAGETKYGISKRYGISIADLERLNPSIVKNAIAAGQQLQVPLLAETNVQENVAVSSSAIQGQPLKEEVQQTLEVKKENEIVENSSNALAAITQHEVKSKETKYGIAKKYGITVAQLEEWNPTLQGALKVGALLQVKAPTTESVVTENTTVASSENDNEVVEKHEEHFYGDMTQADELIERASDNIGVRYRSGGTTRAGFDCSGLICATFSAMDIKLPRSSIEQSNIGIKVTPQEAKKGDLIFFKTRGGRRINHVGMVVDVIGDEIKFIHSSTSQGVIISSTKEAYYHRNFAQVNRVLR